jgi:tripartite-type tricarboxylate transporter receptor subunit TctC
MKQWMLIAAAIAGSALQPAASAVAADYPVRPITLIVPQAPGGGNDVIARILAETMSRTLGQQIIVENRPGAGGTIGTRQLAKSPPDGYTLVMGSTGTVAMAPSVFPNVGYDPRKDFAPIGLIARSAIVLVVGPAVAARSVRELIEAGKDEPGKLTYGSGGVGSGNHLAGALFATMAGIKMTHVPFRGATRDQRRHRRPPRDDLQQPAAHARHTRCGQLRALATVSQALSLLRTSRPSTIRIAWLPGATDYGLLLRPGTPAEIVKLPNGALQEARPDLVRRIAADGAEPRRTPEDYAQDIDREETKWSKVVKRPAFLKSADPDRRTSSVDIQRKEVPAMQR